MIDSEKPLDQISGDLLVYLRQALDNPTIRYKRPLAQLQGGYETCTYRFELAGVEREWARPLVLRLYPRRFGAGNAVWESAIQNLLADEGIPAARAHLTCADRSVLGGAFFIMEFLEGVPMLSAPFETIPGLLGQAHAALHDVDPAPLVRALRERGVEERRYRLAGRLAGLVERAAPYPWLGDVVDWLVKNRPPEPERLSICHGDFHPLNLLVQDERVTGVLDWPGFIVADPVLDVATTIVLTMLSAKHNLGLVEWQPVVERYLDAYRTHRALDLRHLDYYKVRRGVHVLVEGASGQAVWQNPAIVQDLIAFVYEVTAIRIQT